jgi:hypothetical protein
MLPIIADAVLVVVLAVLAAAGAWQIFSLTPAGVRHQQARNRRRIEQGGGYLCSVHGAYGERELVRLRSGETLCPQCYAEIHDADLH